MLLKNDVNTHVHVRAFESDEWTVVSLNHCENVNSQYFLNMCFLMNVVISLCNTHTHTQQMCIRDRGHSTA